MIETLIITLREGLEAAIIVSIIVTFLQQQNRRDLLPAVWTGLISALVLGVVGVFAIPVLLARLHMNEEAYEGLLYIGGSVLVASFLVWLYRHRGWASGVRQRAQTTLSHRWARVGFFLLTFIMVFREAVETMLFIGAISLTSTWLLQWLGFLMGASLAVLFGLAMVRGSRWVPIQRIFRLSLIVLVVLLFQFVVAGLHELIEAEWIPGGPVEMAIIGPVVNNHMVVFAVILGIILVWAIFSRSPESQGAEASNTRAARRLLLAEVRTFRRWRLGLIVLATLSAGALLGFYLYQRPPAMARAQTLVPQSSEVRIPVTSIPLRKVVYYEVEAGTTSYRLLLLQPKTGDYRVTLDACTLCGPKGYYQKGDKVICRHCGAPLIPETVGQPGGCNPVPIQFKLDGETIRVSVRDIEEAFAQVAHR